MSERITRLDADGVCTLTLNRPDKLNALDTPAFEALEAHAVALETDDSIGCVVLRGAGRAFCAGADLKALGTGTERPTAYKAGVIDRLAVLPKPVVAAVHGVCFTGGLELALACDFILADANARFSDTHGKWGFVATWGMTQRLSRRIGVAPAKRMMMTARIVGASEARDMGLIDLLAPDGGFDDLVRDFAAEVCANSGFTNAAAKRLLTATDGMSVAEALAYEQAHYLGRAPDSDERVARFGRG